MNPQLLSRLSRLVIHMSLLTLMAATAMAAVLLTRQWGTSAMGVKPQMTPGPLVESDSADLYWKRPLMVAIIDTGMDVDHPDLQGLMVDGWNFADASADISDQHGHGTHIAGIIHRQLAVLEASTSRPVRFMILKYYAENRSGRENLDSSNAALAYAIEKGADIINYSGGGREPSATERALMERALRKGILIVAAAGNESINTDREPFYPASYGLENIISVAGATSRGSVSRSSNFGPHSVDIAAPGERILSTSPGSSEAYMTGTSQATAFVTGAVAAFLAGRPGPVDFVEIRARLYATAELLPELSGLVRSGGEVSLENLVSARSSGTTADDLWQVNGVADDESFYNQP